MDYQTLYDFYEHEKAGQPVDPEMAGYVDTFRRAGYLPPAGTSMANLLDKTRPIRNNNPLNVTTGALTEDAPGIIGEDPSPATDNPNARFPIFGTPEHGFAAAVNLLGTEGYTRLPLEQAMRRWSNSQYGADVAQDLGLAPDTPMATLDPKMRTILAFHMAKKEGYDTDRIDPDKLSAILGSGGQAMPTTQVGTAPVGGQPGPGVQPGPGPTVATSLPTTTPTSATVAAQPAQSLVEQTIAPHSGGNPIEEYLAAMLQRMHTAGSELPGAVQQFAAEPGIGSGARVLGRAAGAVEPLALGLANIPQAVGGIGARALGSASPVSPATAEMLGSFAPLGVGLARGGARALSPTLRQIRKLEGNLAAKTGANVAAQTAREAQLAERTAAGAPVQEVIRTIGRRLEGEATPFREIPIGGVPETVTVTSLSKSGKLVSKEVPAVEAAATPFRDADFATDFDALRQANERGGHALKSFEAIVKKKTAELGPHDTAVALAKHPDVLNGVLVHASPEEAAVIQRAFAAGKPIGKMPYSQAEIAKLAEAIADPTRPSLLKPLALAAVSTVAGTAGLGGMMGGMMLGTGLATGGLGAGALATTVLALRGLDAMISSRAGQAIFRRLGGVAPGSREAAQLMAALGNRLAGPAEIERRD